MRVHKCDGDFCLCYPTDVHWFFLSFSLVSNIFFLRPVAVELTEKMRISRTSHFSSLISTCLCALCCISFIYFGIGELWKSFNWGTYISFDSSNNEGYERFWIKKTTTTQIRHAECGEKKSKTIIMHLCYDAAKYTEIFGKYLLQSAGALPITKAKKKIVLAYIFQYVIDHMSKDLCRTNKRNGIEWSHCVFSVVCCAQCAFRSENIASTMRMIWLLHSHMLWIVLCSRTRTVLCSRWACGGCNNTCMWTQTNSLVHLLT